MSHVIAKIALRLTRVMSLVLLATIGTIVMMRVGPGYFSDEREMDAQYSAIARVDIDQRQVEEGTLRVSIARSVRGLVRGDLGRSKEYDVPVVELLRERAGKSVELLAKGVVAGWAMAFSFALLLGARRTASGEALIAGWTALMLALPLGALATVCMVTNHGGPVFVMALLIAVRDFKLLYKVLRQALRGQQVLYARAQGFSLAHIVRVHLFCTLKAELLSLAMMSFAVALSAIVPVEVIFDVAGVGQLAWSAAMNRDLPVLVAATLLMAACVGVAGIFVVPETRMDTVQCA